MRKAFPLLLLVLTGLLGFAKPEINRVVFPKEINIFELYEISFQLGNYANPYDPEVIDVYAEIVGPNQETFTVVGFYYEGYRFEKQQTYEVATRDTLSDGWKIRFTPNAPGKWTFAIHAVDADAKELLTSYDSLAFEFQCNPNENAEGFIRKANSRYLKRETFAEDQKQFKPFYPVGPNVAWYQSDDYYVFSKPHGIYEYQRYTDSLTGNANYMRIWLNRYQYLALYGPEHALRENNIPVNYFDSTVNQKDSAELDSIISYANLHSITVMPCFFTYDDFRNDSEGLKNSARRGCMPSGWMYNPYHTLLGLETPMEFFTDPKAKRITKNLIRYIVARWGYATNVMAWELWNEVSNIFRDAPLNEQEGQAVIDWHNEMCSYIHSKDPFQHLVTTSFVTVKGMEHLFEAGYQNLDIAQQHTYAHIQKAKSRELTSRSLFDKSIATHQLYPTKPFFMGEYGVTSKVEGIDNYTKDPKGFELHNTLWSSTFSGAMGPASFWYWHYLDKQGLFTTFRPVAVFCAQLPMLSDTFMPRSNGVVAGNKLNFPNNIETYYLINATEDTLLGWCQDEAFNYQALRRLTDRIGTDGHFDKDGVFDPSGYVYTKDPAKRPRPSSKSNVITIPITEQRARTQYAVRWFDAETGLEMASEATVVRVKNKGASKELRFKFPSSVRDVKRGTIHNPHGDAVFMIYKISD